MAPSNTGVTAWKPSTASGPAQVGFENLADVHSARHAQGIQQNVDRRAVIEERHVFLRDDAGDNALVAVPAGHLVADRQLPLGGDIDLDHFQHAAGEFVAALHVFHAAIFFLQHRLDARPESAVGVLGLFLGFLRVP